MPPKSAKSKEAPTERPILGRFSSHLKIGIVSSSSPLDSRFKDANFLPNLLDGLRSGRWGVFGL